MGTKSNYDRQLILQIDMDSTAGNNRQALEDRAVKDGLKSCTLLVSTAEIQLRAYRQLHPDKRVLLRNHLKELTTSSRLYILGHGDWQSQKVGGLSGETLAKLLYDHGLQHAKVISLVACSAGRDLGAKTLPRLRATGFNTELARVLVDPAQVRVDVSVNSFASRFHQELCAVHEIYIDVFARTLPLTAVGGQKTVMTPDLKLHNKKEDSKFRFTFRNGRSIREVVEY